MGMHWNVVVYVLIFINTAVAGEIGCLLSNRCPELVCLLSVCPATFHCPSGTLKQVKREKHKNLTSWKTGIANTLANTLPLDPVKANFVRQVRGAIFSQTLPSALTRKPVIAAHWKHVLDGILDFDVKAAVNDLSFLAFVSGNTYLGEYHPLTHRYGGHQFGVWADQLGDGRAHMIAEYVNGAGERWELQLKGSGKTPYSRRGDGRAVIRSSVREFLCSEAMYFLGIPTSRAATLVVSDDPVYRDQFYNGNLVQERAAVVLRLAESWFRFGSFEILTNKEEFDLLKSLADFTIENFFMDIGSGGTSKYFEFYSRVVDKTARLMALWQSVGFAHGVMNTDNFSILSITIDYGPFGFLDAYDPGFVPNTSDDERRYSFKKQPDVGRYNLDKLRKALLPLVPQRDQINLQFILNGYNNLYKDYYIEIFNKKLGISPNTDLAKSEYLTALLLKIMEDSVADYTMTLRQLGDWRLLDISRGVVPAELWALEQISHHQRFQEWAEAYYESTFDKWNGNDVKRMRYMHNVNPRYVLRNWMAQAAIVAAEKDDFMKIERLQRVLSRPYTEQEEAELAGYAAPPPTWAQMLRVSCSS